MFIFRKLFFSILVFFSLLSYANSADSDENICKKYGTSVRYILSERIGGKTQKETIQTYKEIVNSMKKEDDISAETYNTLMQRSVTRAYSLKLYSGNFLKNIQISDKFAKDEEKFCMKEMANMHRKIDEHNAKINAEIQRLRDLKKKLSSSRGIESYYEVTSPSNKSEGKLEYNVNCTNGSRGYVYRYPVNGGYNIFMSNHKGITSQHVNMSVQDAIQKVCR